MSGARDNALVLEHRVLGAARFISDPAADELAVARATAEAQLDRLRRRIIRHLNFGARLQDVRWLLAQLRNARVELALIADLERSLASIRAEESPL